jgi:hypothetical protein
LSPLLKALWPFITGCVLVAAAGAAGYFNFCYMVASLPSPEALHNFLSPTAKTWPTARFQRQDESPEDFNKRFRWKESATRWMAIVFASASVVFFGYGAFLMLRIALRDLGPHG